MTVVRIKGSGQVIDMVPVTAAQFIQMGRATAVDPEKEKNVIETAVLQGRAPVSEQAVADRQKMARQQKPAGNWTGRRTGKGKQRA